MRYRRSTTPGATYFFAVVTYRRRAILCEPETVALLREPRYGGLPWYGGLAK